jgi:hypothetical protein
MADITAQELDAWLDDALEEADQARIEKALRESDELRQRLQALLAARDRGEHSVGAVWRRERLSCPSRERLGSYVLGAVDPDWQDYIDHHVGVIGCPFCMANVSDLKARQEETPAPADERRRRFFESSAGLLRPDRPG